MRKCLFLSLVISLSLMFAVKAQAYNSPMESLRQLSKKRIVKIKEVSVENSSLTEQKIQVKQNNQLVQPQEKTKSNIPSRTPKAVLDPAEVEKAVEFAANVTGVRKNFIMGLLVVESNLGRNPGQCTYAEVESGAKVAYESGRLSGRAWSTFQQRSEIIKDVASDLGYDYEKLNVSCNPGAAYAGTGGAMGIPQFMPDTWMEYKERIAAIVGKENPDPWNEKDAAVAVALKLSDVYGVTSHNRLAERNAAKMYLSGTTSSYYDWYANKILYWAENYRNLIG